MILFGLFSRHRSLKLKKIKSDRNVDVVMTVVIVVSFCLPIGPRAGHPNNIPGKLKNSTGTSALNTGAADTYCAPPIKVTTNVARATHTMHPIVTIGMKMSSILPKNFLLLVLTIVGYIPLVIGVYML